MLFDGGEDPRLLPSPRGDGEDGFDDIVQRFDESATREA
jgi:hypothetical protein